MDEMHCNVALLLLILWFTAVSIAEYDSILLFDGKQYALNSHQNARSSDEFHTPCENSMDKYKSDRL